ncbi:MAG: GNAT family N-acetyltransferase [Candidatus Eremiobacteraeota bacterium]|nr:GNAT family N-acetyltransferase [Candidatus Eremiobacteraeota bacterium]
MRSASSVAKPLHAAQMLRVRRASVADAATVVDVSARAYATISALVPYPSLTQADVAAFLKRPNAGAYISLCGRLPVGSVSFVHDRQVLQLFRLGVLPSHRRRGIAQALIDAVESHAKRKRVRIVFLQTAAVLELAPYYERLGYQIKGEEADTAGGRPITRIDLYRMV